MARGMWLRRAWRLVLCSSILLGIQCPPLMVDSFKTGVANWVAGTFNLIDLGMFTDLIIGSDTGGNQFGL